MTEFGVSLPNIGMHDPQAIRLVAEQAEAAGLDSVWAADHIVLPTGETSPYPYDVDGDFLIPAGMPFMDQFTCLSYVAGITKSVKLGTAVMAALSQEPLPSTSACSAGGAERIGTPALLSIRTSGESMLLVSL